MNNGLDSRLLAARAVHAVLFAGRSLKAVLNETLPQLPDSRDRALVEAIVMAVIRNRGAYALALDSMTQRRLGARDADLRALLYVGLAQLHEMNLPAHAAVATTVDAARAMGRAHQAGMVNAILRRAQREGLPSVDPALEWPEFLRDLVSQAYATAPAVFAASAVKAPMFLRVNLRQTTRDTYLQQLEQAGIAATEIQECATAIGLDTPVPVAELPGFADGVVSVQDLSAQMATALLELRDGLRILDACAAPGGKTAAILECSTPQELIALDNNARRLAQIRATLDRVGVASMPGVQLQAADARDWRGAHDFDRILLDVPCSSTGVVRRQPDILLHRRPQDLDALIETQRALLDNAWSQLAPGGLLLYTTCSILPAENALQIREFLADHRDAFCEPVTAAGYGDGVWIDDLYCGQQRLTGDLHADGFFYAQLRKRDPQ